MTRLIFLTLLWSTTTLAQGFGGAPNPVKVVSVLRSEAVPTVAGATELSVKLAIEAPYHIYGVKAAGSELPTEFGLTTTPPGAAALGTVTADRAPSEHRDATSIYDYYEGEVTFRVPIVWRAAGPVEVQLKITVVACDDRGCRPPKALVVKESFEVQGNTGQAAPTPFDEETKARVLGATYDSAAASVRIELEVEPGWHIYGLEAKGVELPTTFRVGEGATGWKLGKPSSIPTASFHAGENEYDRYDYYEGKVTFVLPVTGPGQGVGSEFALPVVAEWMTCDENGCKPPSTTTTPVLVRPTAENLAQWANTPAPAAVTSPPASAERTAYLLPPEQPVKVSGAAVPSVLESFAPGKSARLVLVFPEGSAPATIERRLVQLTTPSLRIEGDGQKSDDGLSVTFPVTIREQQPDGEFQFRGTIALESGEMQFGGRGLVATGIWAFLGIAIVSALAALLTPCVYPMIPITISFFTKQGEKSNRPAWQFGLIYCTGIVISFTAIGALFTLLIPGGAGAQNFALHWATQLAIAALFVFFACSLLGGFELQLPASVMGLVGKAQSKGGTLGIWMLGVLFAVTSFTCTAQFVGALLAGARASGAWSRPILGMLAFSSVLALPFFFLAAFPSKIKSLPRAGSWMNEVKVCMGFIEIAAAFKFLGGMDMALGWGFFSRQLVLIVWVVCFGLMGVYLLGTFRMPHDSPRAKTSVTQLVLAMISLVVAMYLSSGLSGDKLDSFTEPYLPVERPDRTPEGRISAVFGGMGWPGALAPPSEGKSFVKEDWKNRYDEARVVAAERDKLLFVDFTGYT